MSETPIITLPLDQVVVGARLRPVDPDYVALLAASLLETGQHTPIQVGPADGEGRHPLIAGAHRVTAAREAGLPDIKAVVFEGNELQRRMLEIDENLMRRELSELDRAVFLAERKAIYEALHPEAKQGGDRRKGQTEENFRLIHRQESFAAETAKKLGVSDRQVRTYLARARIDPKAREQLAGTRWADHGATLDALAKQPPLMQAKIVAALTRAESPARNLQAALEELEPRREPVRSVDDEQFARLQATWRKAGAAARKRFLAHVLLADHATRRQIEEAIEGAGEGEDRVLRAIASGRAA